MEITKWEARRYTESSWKTCAFIIPEAIKSTPVLQWQIEIHKHSTKFTLPPTEHERDGSFIQGWQPGFRCSPFSQMDYFSRMKYTDEHHFEPPAKDGTLKKGQCLVEELSAPHLEITPYVDLCTEINDRVGCLLCRTCLPSFVQVAQPPIGKPLIQVGTMPSNQWFRDHRNSIPECLSLPWPHHTSAVLGDSLITGIL